MGKASGILGVTHVAVFTSRIEEAERHYADLFGATVLFRGATHRGLWVGIDAAHGWEEIRRRGITVEQSFMRAGGLTLVVADERSSGAGGPLDHVGIGCSDPEFRRIKERVRVLGLRVLEESLRTVKVRDAFGVTWDLDRGGEVAARPERMLDLETGRVE